MIEARGPQLRKHPREVWLSVNFDGLLGKNCRLGVQKWKIEEETALLV